MSRMPASDNPVVIMKNKELAHRMLHRMRDHKVRLRYEGISLLTTLHSRSYG